MALSQDARPDAVQTVVRHICQTSFDDLPDRVVDAVKKMTLDSLGVALAGTLAPGTAETLSVLGRWGGREESSLWVVGGKLPVPAAAMVNSFLIHNQEFDCVHDAAVLHPMTAVLPAALATAEAVGNVSGKELLTAVALGANVACLLGTASRSAMRHFRPGTAGAFGATAAAGKILGFEEAQLANAMGVVYSQISGTLQPHHEGSLVNSMQIGFNARNALTAVALAAEGIPGPRNVLEGPYGYLKLFEGEYDVADLVGDPDPVWQVDRVSQKPYSCGRLTHGAVDAALSLRREKSLAGADIEECRVTVPPLVRRLVGRSLDRGPLTAQFAKLSIPFVVATAFVRGGVFVTDFAQEALRDETVLRLADRVRVDLDETNRDENAMGPVRLDVRLTDGTTYTAVVEHALGHPDNPLTREQHLEKFRRCWEAGAGRLPETNRQQLIDVVDGLEDAEDAALICRLLTL